MLLMDLLYHVRNNIMYGLLCAHLNVILVFISINTAQLWEINTKITLLLAHKRFATQVHTLFYINLDQ